MVSLVTSWTDERAIGRDDRRDDRRPGGQSVDVGAATLTVKWAPEPVTAGRVYRFSLSSRRKPYVDLLVALHNSKKANDVHEAGFNS